MTSNPGSKETKTIKRIREMETILDTATEKLDAVSKALADLRAYQSEIRKLESYYTGKDWKKDFAADETGKLPKDLKRGVLSEDGIDTLLERYSEYMKFLEEE